MHCPVFLLLASLLLCLVAAAPVPEPNPLPATLEARKLSTFTGQATWFLQEGQAGSCGKKNKDSALIVAVNTPQVAGGSHCGKTVKITNKSNGKTVTATVADECPGCGYGSLDLSTGAFKKIGNMNTGVLPISWQFA